MCLGMCLFIPKVDLKNSNCSWRHSQSLKALGVFIRVQTTGSSLKRLSCDAEVR